MFEPNHTGTLHLAPCTITRAKEFVRLYHRHHKPPTGALFAVQVEDEEKVCGVALVGRPVARMLQDGKTCEVVRLCSDGTSNVCSMLYSACARAAKALGYRRILTYILSSEPGTSLRASGWSCDGEAGGGSWSRPSRERDDKHPLETKVRWSKEL